MLSGYIHEQAKTREIPLLKGLKKSMPRTSVLVVLASMAAMGVPIFSPFLSEYMIIVGAISVDVRLAVAMLIPVIVVGYFLYMIRRVIFSPFDKTGLKHHDMSRFTFIYLILFLIPLVLLLIFPSLILNLTNPVAESLIQLGG
jgi:NADH-quinone oxidoreductase subunit M